MASKEQPAEAAGTTFVFTSVFYDICQWHSIVLFLASFKSPLNATFKAVPKLCAPFICTNKAIWQLTFRDPRRASKGISYTFIAKAPNLQDENGVIKSFKEMFPARQKQLPPVTSSDWACNANPDQNRNFKDNITDFFTPSDVPSNDIVSN